MSTTDTVKFEEKRTMSASKTKVITDGFSSEQVNIVMKAEVVFYSTTMSSKPSNNVLSLDRNKTEKN